MILAEAHVAVSRQSPTLTDEFIDLSYTHFDDDKTPVEDTYQPS